MTERLGRLSAIVVAWMLLVLAGCAARVDDGAEDLAPEEDAILDDGEGAADGLSVGSDALVTELLDDEERTYLGSLNTYRTDHGLVPVRVSITLTRAANFHSDEMADHEVMQHDSFDGTSMGDRVDRYYPSHGLSWGLIGEIVAYEFEGSGTHVFGMWRDSPTHDAIMRTAQYRAVGISRMQAANGYWYWTADFGDVKDALLSAGVSSIASNGGFESDAFTNKTWSTVRTLNRWHRSWASGGNATRTTNHFAGSYGMRVVDPSAGHVAMTQLVRALNGVNYRVTAAVQRRSGATQQTLFLDFLNGSYERIVARTVPTGTSASWTRIQVEDVAPAGTRYVRILLYGSAAGSTASTYDWDDVRLTAW